MCHAATHAMKSARFPSAADPIDTSDPTFIEALKGFDAPDRIITSAALAATETARAFGWEQTSTGIDTAWNDLEYGAWSGRPVRDIHDTEPDALSAWLSDPASSPVGGESLEALRTRGIGAL